MADTRLDLWPAEDKGPLDRVFDALPSARNNGAAWQCIREHVESIEDVGVPDDSLGLALAELDELESAIGVIRSAVLAAQQQAEVPA